MKKTIQINLINISGQKAPILLDIAESDLFYLKAKRIIAEQLKGYAQEEFVFYSKSKKQVIHEEDRVSKLFQNKEDNQIDLYLTSDLIKKVVQGGLENEQINVQQQNYGMKSEREIKDINLEIKKLQNALEQQRIDYMNELLQQQKSMKEQFEAQQKEESVHTAEIIKKFKDSVDNNRQLNKQIMEKNNQIEELNYQIKNLEAENNFISKQITKDTKDTKIEKNDEIMEIKSQFEEIKKFLDNEKFQRKKDQVIISNLEIVIQDLKNKQQQSQQQIEEMNQRRTQTEQQIDNLKEELKRSNEKCCEYKDQSTGYKKEISHWDNKFTLIQKQKLEIDEKFNLNSMEFKNLQSSLEEKQQEIIKKDLIINDITNQKDILNTQILNLEENIENLNSELNNKVEICQIMEYESKAKSVEIEELQNKLNIEIEQKKQTIQKAKLEWEKLQETINEGQDKIKVEEQKRATLVKRVKEYALMKKRDTKFISPTQNLYQIMPKPLDFLNNENVMTKDDFVEVEIIKINNNNAIKNLTKSDYPNITSLVIREFVGKWKIKQNIQINGDGTKRKGYLMQVMKSNENSYNGQVFLIKQLVGFEDIVTIEKALYVAQNSLIAKVLAKHFQDKIEGASIIPPCKFTYQEPFLLKKEGKYYIAEKLMQGHFFNFNEDTNSDVASYLYAFQIFTYLVTQKMLMVSNFQGNFNGSEYILCDPIISSPEGIMGEEDLAEPHIQEILENYNKNQNMCGKYYIQGLELQL